MSVAIGESELQMDFISEKFWTYLDLVFTLAVFLGTSTTTGAKKLGLGSEAVASSIADDQYLDVATEVFMNGSRLFSVCHLPPSLVSYNECA